MHAVASLLALHTQQFRAIGSRRKGDGVDALAPHPEPEASLKFNCLKLEQPSQP